MDLYKKPRSSGLLLRYESHHPLHQNVYALRNNPAIWNASFKDYSLRLKKEDPWQRMTDVLGMDMEELKDKLSFMRFQYQREQKKIEESTRSSAGADSIYKPTWYSYREAASS